MEMISLDYLKRLIGISVRYISTEDLHLPNFLMSRYRIRKVLLDSVEVFFLYPITELESVWNLKKHIEHILKSATDRGDLILFANDAPSYI